MKFLVTGCAGFIGSHLCEKLINNGHSVVGIDNFDNFYSKEHKLANLEDLQMSDHFRLYEVDIKSEVELNKIEEEFEIVIHLAAKAGVRPSIESPSSYIDTNITGTQNILNLMLKKGVNKIVFASSSSVYGDNTVAPYSESAVVDFPISPYAFTKKSGELMLFTHFHLYKISSVSLRFFTVYGPRQRPDLAINKFFRLIMNDEPISVFGDGSTMRDYTFIDDIIAGILSAVDYVWQQDPVYEIVNLGNSRPSKLLELINKIENTVGKKAILNFKDMQPGDVKMTCADTAKANALLRYEPKITLNEGLRLYYQWKYQNNNN